ncbi:MAG: dGTP triphosphohydrolase [Bacillota bacterium]
MKWEELLMPYRLGYAKSNPNPNRTEFQKDFDRIIFSTNFRRLNGKTQVFPFPETDIIHTRLTHSLEASSVGRSLGTIVGNKLNKKDKSIRGWEFGNVCSVACLAHDIGNPPFGHSGEDAIAEYYNSERGENILEVLTEKEKEDFRQFEGNSMGFHILTYSNQKTGYSGGYGLTYPSLAAFIKYPRASLIKNKNNVASEKKPGLFQCDIENYRKIAKGLNIPCKEDGDKWYRHPLAFLTEAADDICYTIMDLEDGFKHGLVSYKKTYKWLKNIANADSGETKTKSLNNIKNKRDKISYLRAKAINSLIHQIANVFIEKEKEILEGNFDKPITKVIESSKLLSDILDTSIKNIYSHNPVIQVEAAGFKVLPGLLDNFLYALKNDEKSSSKMILKLIPEEFKYKYHQNPYKAIMNITTYVAGMTDTFAVDTFRNLQGIELPNY